MGWLLIWLCRSLLVGIAIYLLSFLMVSLVAFVTWDLQPFVEYARKCNWLGFRIIAVVSVICGLLFSSMEIFE